MSPTGLTFAVGVPSRRVEIEAVLRQAFDPYVARLGRALGPGAYDWLPASLERGEVFVAVDGDAIVGVVATATDGDRLEIDQIAVRPGDQGRGVGSWLLQQITAHAVERRCEALVLNTAVMMEDLLRLYRRHGFVEERRGPPAHGRDGHQRAYLRKSLT